MNTTRQAELVCEAPNASLYTFAGTLTLAPPASCTLSVHAERTDGRLAGVRAVRSRRQGGVRSPRDGCPAPPPEDQTALLQGRAVLFFGETIVPIASGIRVIVAWVSLAMAPAAFAGIVTPGAGVESDLFIALVNPVSGTSEVVDLGPVAEVIGKPRTWTIDRRYATRLGAGGLTYQLVAGDLSRQGDNGYAGIVLYTSASNASLSLMAPPRWRSVAIANSISTADQYLMTFEPRFQNVDGWMTFVSDGREVMNWGPLNARPTAPGRQLGLPSFDAVAPASTALKFFRVVAGPTDAGLAVDGQVELLGTFLLRGSKLTFTPSPGGK